MTGGAGDLQELSRHLPYHCPECAQLARAAAKSDNNDDKVVVVEPRPSTPTTVVPPAALEVRLISAVACIHDAYA